MRQFFLVSLLPPLATACGMAGNTSASITHPSQPGPQFTPVPLGTTAELEPSAAEEVLRYAMGASQPAV